MLGDMEPGVVATFLVSSTGMCHAVRLASHLLTTSKS